MVKKIIIVNDFQGTMYTINTSSINVAKKRFLKYLISNGINKDHIHSFRFNVIDLI